MHLLKERSMRRLMAAVLCGLLAAWPGVAAEKGKASAPEKQSSAQKAPAKAKAKAKSSSKSKAKAKPAAKKEQDAPPHVSTLPWSIRGQYSIAYGDTVLLYSSDNVEWCIRRGEKDVIVDNVGMAITLGDGSVVNMVDCTRGETNFEQINDASGSYRRFWVQPAPQKGIVLRHSLDRYSDRPYMIMRSEIRNASEQPITVREVTLAVLGPKGMALSGDAAAAVRPVGHRGGYAVYEPKAPQFALFTDPAKKFMLGIGTLPESPAPNAVAFAKADGVWRGKITSDYSPGRVLKPGESLKPAPLFINFYMPKASDIETGYAHAMASLPKPAKAAPPAWVTVSPKEPVENLLAVAQAWAGSDVKHVLAPAPFTGAAGYPYDARQTASQLKSMKMKPGIAVEPLGMQGAPESMTVAGPDGRRWINPTLPEAREYAAQQLKPLTEWGYAFFVVPPSEVPDEALKAFGISRGEADAMAFEIATAAAGDAPVVPSPAATLGKEVDPWLEAAGALARLRIHGGVPGPVRVDAAALGDPSDGLAMAMSFYPGPVELVGVPSRRVKSLFPQPVVFAQPVDGTQQAPKLWQAQEHRPKGSSGNLVVAFPGAPAWTDADLAADFKGKPKTLRVEADGRVSEAKS
jgi:hypothetical protein